MTNIPPDKFVELAAIVFVKTCRTGCKGAWDMLKAAITGNEIYHILEPIKITCHVRCNKEAYFEVNGVQMELSKQE